jgi:hypothetical protein
MYRWSQGNLFARFFNNLSGGDQQIDPHGLYRDYAFPDDALTDLNRAALRWAKRAVTDPRLRR